MPCTLGYWAVFCWKMDSPETCSIACSNSVRGTYNYRLWDRQMSKVQTGMFQFDTPTVTISDYLNVSLVRWKSFSRIYYFVFSVSPQSRSFCEFFRVAKVNTIISRSCVVNLLLNLPVKELWKSINIKCCWRYDWQSLAVCRAYTALTSEMNLTKSRSQNIGCTTFRFA